VAEPKQPKQSTQPKEPKPCLFCAIVAGAPAHRVLDRPDVVAFLDIRPLFPGHVLVVPRSHTATLTDLPTEAVGGFFTAVQQVTAAVETAMEAAGSFVAINNRVSQSVPHLHVHVVPRNRSDGLRGFFWPRQRYDSDKEMAQVAARIRDQLDRHPLGIDRDRLVVPQDFDAPLADDILDAFEG
jgi:histidine triad (HIT) family protein